jgi:hypothetical protein
LQEEENGFTTEASEGHRDRSEKTSEHRLKPMLQVEEPVM